MSDSSAETIVLVFSREEGGDNGGVEIHVNHPDTKVMYVDDAFLRGDLNSAEFVVKEYIKEATGLGVVPGTQLGDVLERELTHILQISGSKKSLSDIAPDWVATPKIS